MLLYLCFGGGLGLAHENLYVPVGARNGCTRRGPRERAGGLGPTRALEPILEGTIR
jgi:hypothetical protein